MGLFGGGRSGVQGSRGRNMPSLGFLSQIRRVDGEVVEDYSGNRYGVWRVAGCDPSNMQILNGWLLMLNSIEYPIQILIRQHSPDLSDVRQQFIDSRPDSMREGQINDVGNSMLDFLQSMEETGRVVNRRWFVIAQESRVMEFSSLLAQAGFEAGRLDHEELSLLVQACVSGMGYGHTQDFYQAKEESRDIELNHRYMAVYGVHKWPRRVSTFFLEQLLRTGEEMDLSLWIWPVSQRESHTRLIMQRSRFEGARLTAEQKGKLVPAEVELAIGDVVRISDEVERGSEPALPADPHHCRLRAEPGAAQGDRGEGVQPFPVSPGGCEVGEAQAGEGIRGDDAGGPPGAGGDGPHRQRDDAPDVPLWAPGP